MNRRTEIEQSLRAVRAHIPDYVTLIVVTKTYPLSDIEILASLGERNFGENRASELAEKAAATSAIWHFQGQIQSNKIKTIAQYVDVLHSLDDVGHVSKFETALDRQIDTFLQVSLDGSSGRGGVSPQELFTLATRVMESSHLNLVGLMAVAPLGQSPDIAFARLANIHRDFLKDFPFATSLSAGMSGDYQVAIEHGATHIRIGSQILGSRPALG